MSPPATAQEDPEEYEEEDADCFRTYRLSLSAANLGYTTLSRWLRDNGGQSIGHMATGVSFDVGWVLDDAWGELGITGIFPPNENVYHFIAIAKGGPRFPLRRLTLYPGIGVGWGSIMIEDLRLRNYSCPTGDCELDSDNFWLSLHLGQLYRLPGNSRTSILVGGYFQPLLRLGRNRWEYGYLSEDEWIGTRVPEVPSTPRLVLTVGVTLGLAVTPR